MAFSLSITFVDNWHCDCCSYELGSGTANVTSNERINDGRPRRIAATRYVGLRKAKSFSIREAYNAALTTPDTSLHCETSDMWLVRLAVCLFTSQLSLVFIVRTHGGMARLS